jgi:hypothetical protein
MRWPGAADRLYLDADPVYAMWVRAVLDEAAAIQEEARKQGGS